MIVKEYYVELFIVVCVIGWYYDVGFFVVDIVNLLCIVILNNFFLVFVKDCVGVLMMDGIVKIF